MTANKQTTADISLELMLDQATTSMFDKNALYIIKQDLSMLIKDTITDFGIPARLSIDLIDNQKIGVPFSVHINGQPARIQKSYKMDKVVSARGFVLEVASVIFLNRSLFISLDIAKHIRALWSQGMDCLYMPGQSLEVFQDYLIMFMQRCFSVERGQALAEWEGRTLQECSVANCFEEAVQSLDTLQVTLCHAVDFDTGKRVGDDQSVSEMFDMLQSGMFYELGLRFPWVQLHEDSSLLVNEFRVQLNDVRFPPFMGLAENEFIVNDTVDRLTLLNIQGKEAVNPVNGTECAVIKETNGELENCVSAGLTTWGQHGYMVLELSTRLRRNAGAFVTRDTVQYELNVLEPVFPAVIRNLLERFDLSHVTQVLRLLVDEEISFRNLRDVLQAMLTIKTSFSIDSGKYIIFYPYNLLPYIARNAVAIEDLDVYGYTETVRQHMKRYISHKYTRGGNTLVVYLLEPAIESIIMDSVTNPPLDSQERQKILDAVWREVVNLPPTAQNPVILTTSEIRRSFHELIKLEFPYLSVLCYQELSPDINIQPIARISLD